MRSSLEHARDLQRRGFAVIPVPARSKSPNRKRWQRERWTAADLPAQFAGERNIGVLLGEPSGWLVDIDLDLARAIELADTFLPHTDMVWGRRSKPHSHRVFRVTGPIYTTSWKLANKEIVSLRSTGAQSIAPGSTHESGEPIEWSRDGEAALVAPEVLTAAIEQLVAAIRGARVTEPADTPDSSVRLSGTPEQFVDSLILTGPGQRDAATFQLARGLRHDHKLSQDAANQLFERWLEPSLAHMSNPSRSMARYEFRRAWANARVGLAGCKDLMARSWKECQGEKVADAVIERFKGGRILDLYRLAERMSKIMQGDPIALGSHAAAALLGVSQKHAYCMCRDLEDAGVLEVVKRGTAGSIKGKATLYRFHELGSAPPKEVS